MSAVVIAYVTVGLAVVLYAMRLSAQQRRVARAIEALEERLDETRRAQRRSTRAA